MQTGASLAYGGTVFPGGVHYSLVNNVCGVRYSLGYRIHSDTGNHMASLASLEELFCDLIPEEKRHLLDWIVKDDHLTVFAENLTHWQEIAPYLKLTEAEEAAIERNYDREERRRLVR